MANADFSYIVTGLPAFVKENQELISSQVALGAPSVKRFVPMNVKYKAHLNVLSLSGAFHDGKGCATEYNATASLTNREIVTAILEKKLRLCPDTLLGKWPEYLVRIPADKRDEIPFEAFLINELIINCNEELETLVWQGDTSDDDLIDGVVTILNAASTTIDVAIAAATTKWNAIQAVVAAIPAKLRRKALRVYVAPEFFTALAFELVNANLYHFNPGTPVDSMILPGTKIEVINTDGLAGSNIIVATTADNIYYGTDDEDAQNRVKVGFNEENGYAWMQVRFNAGVQVAFPDWCVLGTIATS